VAEISELFALIATGRARLIPLDKGLGVIRNDGSGVRIPLAARYKHLIENCFFRASHDAAMRNKRRRSTREARRALSSQNGTAGEPENKRHVQMHGSETGAFLVARRPALLLCPTGCDRR